MSTLAAATGLYSGLRRGGGVRIAVGLSAAEQEIDCLRKLGLNVMHAYTRSLPLGDNFATVIVCNSVLHIVQPAEIPASLREIARIAEAHARIWIGEIPRFREPSAIRSFEGTWSMLWWLLRKRGLRTFLGMCLRILNGEQREPVLRTPQVFWADPDDFIRMAEAAGLSVERHFPHQTLDATGHPCPSATRHDYVLRKKRTDG